MIPRPGRWYDSVVSKPRAFRSSQAFRHWLEQNHAKAAELYVRCFKVHARAHGVTYAEALDDALCFGWIDGVRRSIDEDSFSVRFTPRKQDSKWSAVNIRKVAKLEADGRMHESGLAVFRDRLKRPAGYSFESAPRALAPAYLKQLRANAEAWAYYQAQAPWYQRTSAFWVMSGKKEETRIRRLEILIASSAAGAPVPPLRPRPGVTGN